MGTTLGRSKGDGEQPISELLGDTSLRNSLCRRRAPWFMMLAVATQTHVLVLGPPNGLLPTRVCRQLSTYTHLLDHPPIHPLPSADPLCAQTCSHTWEAVFAGPSLLALGSSPQPLRS